MKKFEVIVEDVSAEAFTGLLNSLPYVKQVIKEDDATDVFSLASEAALSEDWLTEERCMVVKDYDGTVLYHTGAYTNAEHHKYDEMRNQCEAWLKETYPDYKNPFAYWD